MGWDQWVSLAAAAIALTTLVIVVIVLRRLPNNKRSPSNLADTTTAGQAHHTSMRNRSHPRPVAAFILNPTKNQAQELREKAAEACRKFGYEPPMILETTEDDSGAGPARQALDREADLVIACGGDGTVRNVATTMAGSGIPMAVVPLGTGNLLARNLDLPIGRIDDMLAVALAGRTDRIDMGWLTVARVNGEISRGHPFLVIAGTGFDAQMVSDTDPRLKARVGWIAYFFAGVRHLLDHKLRVHVQLDNAPAFTRSVRSILIGNCGKLPANVVLIPDAEIDDGWLDVVAIDPRGGLVGWTVLAGEVMVQGLPISNRGPITIDHLRARHVTITLDEPEEVQVDGDMIGESIAIEARIDAGALLIRVPN